MIDRRKEGRKSNKSIDFRRNKIAKIIFYKTIFLPITTFVLSILFLTYIGIVDYLDAMKISDKNMQTIKKIAQIKNDIKRLQKENIRLKQQIAKVNTNVIDKNKIEPLIRKIVNYLILQNIIYDAQIVEMKSDEKYQNVLDIQIYANYDKQILNQETIKNIFYLIFKDIFYIKKIDINNENLNLEIYKKV